MSRVVAIAKGVVFTFNSEGLTAKPSRITAESVVLTCNSNAYCRQRSQSFNCSFTLPNLLRLQFNVSINCRHLLR